MMKRLAPRSGVLVAALATLFASGCKHKPPPPPPQPTSEPAPPPPPKKACEAMNEDCVATGETQAKIPSSDYVFIPPPGWTYAQEAGQTIARVKDQPLAMAVTGVALPPAPPDQAKTRDVLVEKLGEAIGVTLPKKGTKTWTPDWNKGQPQTFGSTVYSVWQNTDAKLADKAGVLLVFTTKDSAGKEIVGLAFCPNDEKSTALVTKSLETFGPGSYQ
jgi:hypothetical protein